MPYIIIHPENFHNEIPDQPGVYKIYSLDDNNIPRPINRLGGIDKQGILPAAQINCLHFDYLIL